MREEGGCDGGADKKSPRTTIPWSYIELTKLDCRGATLFRFRERKLALMLHLNKNKSIGSEKIKATYDEKIKAKPQKGSTIFGGSSTKATANGTNNSKKKTPSSGKTHKNTAKEPTSSFVNTSKSSFWTTCHRCHMH
ncbi:hypothetical protein MTR_0499s0020 [Medicago truncatula]|uniref:Uncharacterized protein n=1 Tax=Medicago truncatula TaxID=3880 RepID=A0A072TE86_MEDTR|nr:hypothetical protein MTR_0499s0020 [Medicago truncatula]